MSKILEECQFCPNLVRLRPRKTLFVTCLCLIVDLGVASETHGFAVFDVFSIVLHTSSDLVLALPHMTQRISKRYVTFGKVAFYEPEVSDSATLPPTLSTRGVLSSSSRRLHYKRNECKVDSLT